MNRSKEPPLCTAERNFILDSIKERKRLDGREIYDYREVNTLVSNVPGNVTVTIGNTRVQACVSCEVTRPKSNRSTEGQLFFNVTLSPMASPGFELVGRSSPIGVETTRVLERCFKESRAIDTESLCIVAGEKVWSIRVDVHVLNHSGNIIDASVLATITALKHFRRPDITVVGETATIHPPSERDPVPLSIHHIPLCITFAFYHVGQYLVVDPTSEEEQVMDGKLLVGMNVHQELCILQLAGGVALLPDQVLRCVQVAKLKVSELCKEYFEQNNNGMDDQSLSSVLTTEQSKDSVSIPLSGCHDQMEEDQDRRDDNETEIKTLGENTVQLYVNNKEKDNNGVIPNEEMNSEEETTVVISGREMGGFERSCDNDRETGTATKKRKKTNKKRKN